MGDREEEKQLQSGQRAALFMAAVGLFWVITTYLGGHLGWSQRVRALFDLMALGGFGWALWMTYSIWRKRQD